MNYKISKSISNPDYDATTDPQVKAQWMRDTFEEEGDFCKCQV